MIVLSYKKSTKFIVKPDYEKNNDSGIGHDNDRLQLG